jgi:putative DNA primase/helicase
MWLMLYGTLGRNGKGVLTRCVRHVLGDFAIELSSELFLAQKNTSNPGGPTPHLMALKGTRLAFASETEDGRRVAKGRIKNLTGGDPICGRHGYSKREENFWPTHLLVLQTNHKPVVSGPIDPAYWDRIRLIKFNLRYVFDEEPDPQKNERMGETDLDKKLMRDESSGILAWLVRGCVDWQKNGLKTPESVMLTTKKYRLQEDHLSQWRDERCCEDEKTQSLTLYEDFKPWWETNVNRKFVPSHIEFGKMMKRAGFISKTTNVKYWLGIGLLPKDDNKDIYGT